MTTGRVALLPLTSTLHHEHGVGGLTPGRLDAQLRLLRASGHERVVLIADEGSADEARDLVRRLGDVGDVVLAVGGSAAAAALDDREGVVTVLGHGVLLSQGCLATLPADRPALACRPPASGWERIDADRHWAGVLRCPLVSVRQSLATLGDWDPQATLLRRAVQDGTRRVDVREGDCAHAFGDPNWPMVLGRERAVRLSAGPRLLSRPVDRITATWAERLADRLPGATAPLLGLALLVAGSVAAAMFDRPALAMGLLAMVAVVGGVAIASLRLSDRGPIAALRLILFAVAVVPLLAITAAGGGWLGLTGGVAGLLAAALLFVVHRGPGPLMGLDVGQAGLFVATLLIGLPLALTAVAPLALLSLLLHPVLRRRMAAAWRGWQV